MSKLDCEKATVAYIIYKQQWLNKIENTVFAFLDYHKDFDSIENVPIFNGYEQSMNRFFVLLDNQCYTELHKSSQDW